MTKKSFTPAEINRITLDYLQAVKLAQGQQAMDLTDLTYRKGWFYLRTPGMNPEAPAIPCRSKEIEAMTTELQKKIPQRADSDDNGNPD